MAGGVAMVDTEHSSPDCLDAIFEFMRAIQGRRLMGRLL